MSEEPKWFSGYVNTHDQDHQELETKILNTKELLESIVRMEIKHYEEMIEQLEKIDPEHSQLSDLKRRLSDWKDEDGEQINKEVEDFLIEMMKEEKETDGEPSKKVIRCRSCHSTKVNYDEKEEFNCGCNVCGDVWNLGDEQNSGYPKDRESTASRTNKDNNKRGGEKPE